MQLGTWGALETYGFYHSICYISESDSKIFQHFVERHVSRLSLKALDSVDHGFDLGMIIEAYELPRHFVALRDFWFMTPWVTLTWVNTGIHLLFLLRKQIND